MVQAVEGVVFPWLDPSRYSFALGIEAEGATWLAGQTASRHDPASGRVVSGGPAAEQARICWDKIEAVLEAAGRGVGECTEVVEYLTAEGLDAQDEIVGERRASCAASTMVVDALVRPDAVLEVEVVAGGPAHQVRLPQLLPIDSDGSVVASGDLVGQCEWVLEEAGRQLAEFGLGLEHVVRTVQQTTPATRRDYRATAEARRRLLGPAFPASTGVLTSRLPHPDVLVALDVWASTAPKEIVRLSDRIEDFCDTASIMTQMDLVITTCTSTAHLAGALGVPFWVLLHHNPDWRWLRHREDSPWYPTARLFQQNRPGDWEGVLEAVDGALKTLISKR